MSWLSELEMWLAFLGFHGRQRLFLDDSFSNTNKLEFESMAFGSPPQFFIYPYSWSVEYVAFDVENIWDVLDMARIEPGTKVVFEPGTFRLFDYSPASARMSNARWTAVMTTRKNAES